MHTRYFIKQKRRKEGERPKERRTGKDGRREGGGERAERKEGRKEGRGGGEEGGRRNEGERETVKTYGFQCSFEIL